MNRKNRKKKKTWLSPKRISQVIILLLVTALLSMYLGKDVALALFNPTKAMRYSEYAASHTIPNSTLFYGTYLITLQGMSDPIYEKADQSASDSNQTNQYYKSELSGGSWFNVTDAQGLTDIMGAGEIISEAELADLYVQYFVDTDGSVIDVLTGQIVNPFDTPNPYDLSHLPELQELWMQYTNSEEAESITQEDYLKNKNSENSGNMRSDVYNYQMLTTFFGLDLRDAETDKLDADIARLYACYQAMKSAGDDENAAIIYNLMDKVDSSRRALVMERLATLDVNCLGTLYNLCSGMNYTTFGDFKDSSDSDDDVASQPNYIRDLEDAASHSFSKDDDSDDWWKPLQEDYDDYDPDDDDAEEPSDSYAIDNGLLSAVGNCIQSCSQSYSTYSSKALTDTDSVLGHADYTYSVQVTEEASADGSAGPINYLRDVENIAGNTIKHSDSELDLLDSSLVSLAEGKYQGAVTAGVSGEYEAAISSGNGASAADNILSNELGDVEAKRSELEFLIDAVKQRESSANALSYVNNCIDWTDKLYSQIPGDDFSGKATGSVDSHMKWLRDLAQAIKDGDDSLKDKLDELNDKKEELQKKRDAALDDNDLAGARDLDASIAAVDQDIAEEEKNTGKSSTDDLADDILSDALSKMADDPDADLTGALGALAGMGATDALDTLADRAEDNGASAATKDAISDAAKEAADNAGGGSGSGSGDGSGSGAGMSEEEILALLADFFGKDIDSLNASELAIATAATSEFSRAGNTAATKLASGFSEKMRSKNNPYLYEQYRDKTPEYINLRTIGEVTQFRYFYDDTRKKATMTQGSKVFTIRSGNQIIERGGAPENMKYKSVFSKYPYISEDDGKNYFGCTAEYVPTTTHAVCVPETIQGRVDELFALLTGGGE